MIESSARGAWADLGAKLRPFVARRLRTEADIDDVIQDVFLRMQRGLPGLRHDERFGPWVYQVARSAIAEYQRSAARQGIPVRDIPDEPAPQDEVDDGNGAHHLASCIAPFVALLPSPYREALTLTELEGLPQKDAATMLGITVSGMKSRVQRGRKQLRAALEDCCHIALDARGRVLSFEPRADGTRRAGCCRGQ